MMRRIRMAALAAVVALGATARAAADEVSVEAVMEWIGLQKKAVVTIDEALRGKKIATALQGLSAEAAAAVLSDYGVEVIEYEAGGQAIVRALLQRNVAQLAMTIEPVMLGENDPIPGGNRIVTKTYYVKHGDANGIQTAVRALMTRDPRRVGNIIYASQNSALVITDLSSALRQYERVIADLDRPSARAERLKNIRLDIEVWHVPTAATLDAIRDKPADAPQSVRQGDGRRIASFTGIAADPNARSLRPGAGGATSSFANDEVGVTLTASPEVDRDRMVVRLGGRLKLGRASLDLPDRIVGVEPGKWALAFAGDPGFVLLLRAREE